MKYSVIINGAAGVGKDTFVELCNEPAQRRGLTLNNFSSVDKLKEDLFSEDEPYNRSPEHRQMLVDAKERLMHDGPEYFARNMGSQVLRLSPPDSVSFLHIREPEQITLTLKYFAANYPGVNTSTLLVVRDGLIVPNNKADTRVADYTGYNWTVHNNASIEDLALEAEEFIDKLADSN